MVQAKTDMKARARELRRAGKAYDEIAAEPGVSQRPRRGAASTSQGTSPTAADLYRRIEGWWCGIVLGTKATT